VLRGGVAAWQFCYNSAVVVNILFATRTLALSAQNVGLSYMCLGIGTVFVSLVGGHLSRRIGPGSCVARGFGLCSCGWLMLAAAPADLRGIAVFDVDLTLLGTGAVLIFVNFISLRQDALADPGPRRAGRVGRRLAWRARRLARVFWLRRCWRDGPHVRRLAQPLAARRKDTARPGRAGRRPSRRADMAVVVLSPCWRRCRSEASFANGSAGEVSFPNPDLRLVQCGQERTISALSHRSVG